MFPTLSSYWPPVCCDPLLMFSTHLGIRPPVWVRQLRLVVPTCTAGCCCRCSRWRWKRWWGYLRSVPCPPPADAPWGGRSARGRRGSLAPSGASSHFRWPPQPPAWAAKGSKALFAEGGGGAGRQCRGGIPVWGPLIGFLNRLTNEQHNSYR